MQLEKLELESTSSSNSSNAGSGLDLLIEGQTLTLNPTANNSALPYLAPLDIVMDNPNGDGSATVPTTELEVTSLPSEFAITNDTLVRSEFAEATESIFSTIDQDENGFLNAKELAGAVEDHSFAGQEVQIISALYQNIKLLSNFSDDELFNESSGITNNDMEKFDDVVDKFEDAYYTSFRYGYDWQAKRFKDFDLNRNNFLSLDEIGAGLNRRNKDSADLEVLTYLENNFDEVGAAHDDQEWIWQAKEISQKDMSDHDKDLHDIRIESIWPLESMVNQTADMQRPEISKLLFADLNNPERSITPRAIGQGNTGDCYFLASVAAVAKSDPNAIVQMIDENPDDTYTVTFPGDKSHPVTVEAPTDSELAMFNRGGPYGIWVSVLEKAYGKYLKTTQGVKGLTDIEGAGNGGDAAIALKTLTGDHFNREAIEGYSKDSITELLLNNFKDGHEKPMAVTTTTTELGLLLSGPMTEDGFVRSHVYTVIGIQPGSNGGYVVEIRNPWGLEDFTPNGDTFITMEQFQKNFRYMVYSS